MIENTRRLSWRGTGIQDFMQAILKTLALGLAVAFFAGAAFGVGPDEAFEPIPDEEVPYGAAANWIMGHQLLSEGEVAEALPFLHQAYRAQPDVPRVALDFQEALAAEGYFQDALNVMDNLVTAWPDSMSYRLRRSSLHLKLGQRDEAMADLRAVREAGETTADLVMTEAALLAAQGQHDKALEVCREGISRMPDKGVRIYLGMASIEQERGATGNIPALMAEASAAYPNEPELWRIRVLALAEDGQKAAAVDVARQADVHFQNSPIPADPEAAPVMTGFPVRESFLVDLADFYAKKGEVRESVSILQPLADADELGLRPSLWLARLYLGGGERLKGAALVQDINDKWPESSRGWFLKGRMTETAEDYEGAIPHYQRAVDLGVHDPEARLGLVRAMLLGWEQELSNHELTPAQEEKKARLSDNTSAAAAMLEETDLEGHLILGYAFRASGKLVQASERFEMAAEDPDLRLLAMTQRSICLDEMGKPKQARGILERLVKQYPDDAEAANSLGYFLAEKNRDLDQAHDLITFALEKDPGNGAFLDSMGWVLYRQNRLEAAFDYLIQAVNVLPDDPVILEHLGIVLSEMGQDSEALDMLRRALAQGGDPSRLNPLISDLASGTDGP